MPTVNKLFGLADPQYDALRVLSTQALQAGVGDGSTSGGGGGLENKIYLWPADGSTISVYDPTQAGLIAALAAAVSGDTVILPSIVIVLTTAVTIPIGVTLRGLSENSELSFSGFSGAAVILSSNSTVYNFTVSLSGTGTEAIGVDATESTSRIIHVDASVSGGTSKNIRYRLGSATSPSPSTTRYNFPYHKSADDKVYIREGVSGAETEIASGGVNAMDIATVRGAWAGPDVYCIDCDGVLRVSSDGLSFSTLATWAENGLSDDGAWAMNTKIDGNGNLIWFRKKCDIGSIVVRMYESGTGSVLSDLTGDLWTVLSNPPAGEIFGNLLIVYGPSLTATMREIWTVTHDTPLVVWAEYDASYSSFVVPTINWHTIAMPSGYAAGEVFENFANGLQTDHAGHYLYVCGKDTNNGDRATLWQLDNLAAIRAAPATAPTWTVIAYDSQVVSAGTLGVQTLTASFYIRCFGDNLYFRAKNDSGAYSILGIYNGSAWTFTSPAVGVNSNFQAVNYGVYADVSLTAGPSTLRDWTGAAIGGTFVSKFGIDHFSEIWRRLDAEIGEFPLLADVRSGSVSGTGAADVEVVSDATIYYSAIPILHVLDGATAHVEGNYYSTLTLDGTGAVEALAGDRSAWDTLAYFDLHASDIQDASFTYHVNPGNPPLSSYLGSGSFFLGNGSNQAVGVTMSGDATLDNTGILTIAAQAVDGSNIAVNNGSIFIGGADGAAHEQSITGDASISNAGVLTLTTVNATPGTYGDSTHLAQITVDAQGRITSVGSIVFVAAGEVLMADGITPPDPLLTDDETDWLYEG